MATLAVLIVAVGALAQSADWNMSLGDIQARVAQNEEQLRDLSVEVVYHLPNCPGAPKVIRLVWAFKSGATRKEYCASTRSYAAGDAPPPFTAIGAFNGKTVLTLALDPLEPSRQIQGSISPPKAVHDLVSSRARDIGEFPRSSGLLLRDRPLSQWLAMSTAQLTGTDIVEARKCVRIDIPYSNENTDWILRCCLAPEYGYALASYEFLKSGQRSSIVTNTAFREVTPGVWLPLSGIVDASRMETPTGIVLEPHPFEVVSLEVNTDIPDSLFEIEFVPGTPVVDFRHSPPVALKWKEGLDPSLLDNDIAKDALEDLDATISQTPSTLPRNEEAANRPAAAEKPAPPPAARPQHAILGVGAGLIGLGLACAAALVYRRRRRQ